MSSASISASNEYDLQTLQAQLRSERARLADEIDDRFGSFTAHKIPKQGQAKNPFTFGQASASTPQIRPIKLGLGAELIGNGESSSQGRSSFPESDKRLKGVLSGKRKRPDVLAPSMSDTVDDGRGDSRGSMISDGLATQQKEISKQRRKDPFAGGKLQKKREVDAASAQDKAVSQREETRSAAPPSVSALSKSARKRLRKKANGFSRAQSVRFDDLDSAQEETLSKNNDTLPSEESPVVPPMRTFAQLNGSTVTSQRFLPAKLAGARFRQINETLYTSPSSNAIQMVKEDPAKLVEYHEGFREQVKSWPKIPVRQIYDLILSAQKHDIVSNEVKKGVPNIKRTGLGKRGALIVDLGAGEGFLAKWLAQNPDIDVRVLSYDLLTSDDGWVVGMDIAHVGGLPLPGRELKPDSSSTSMTINHEEDDKARVVDVAIFCLSLMATNWVDKIREASRMLSPKGELVIAEVTSRFSSLEEFVSLVESLGFKRQMRVRGNIYTLRDS
jgi:ribosomal RNA-processing protein 8